MPLVAAAAAATTGPTRFPTMCRCGDLNTSTSGRHTSGGCGTASPGSCRPWRPSSWAGGLGLHLEHGHRLLELLHILLDSFHHRVMLVAALAAISCKPEIVRHRRHLPGAEVEAACHHVVTDVQGQPVDEMCLEQHPIRLPGWQQGQRGFHQLRGPPVAQLTAVDDLLALV